MRKPLFPIFIGCALLLSPLAALASSAASKSASRKRTLKQLVDLTVKIGVEKPYPAQLADDLGFEKNLTRIRIGIENGKHDVTDTFAVLCRRAQDSCVPVSVLFQVAVPDPNDNSHLSGRSYLASLDGRLLAVASAETHVRDGKPRTEEAAVALTSEVMKLFVIEMNKFLLVRKTALKRI